MFKRLIPFAAVAVALTVTAVRAQETEWKEYKSAGGRFTVQVPGTFEVMPQKLNDPNEPATLYLHTLQARPHSFLITYGDYPQGVLERVGREKVQDNIRDAFLNSIKGKVVSETKAKLGENTGRDLTADFGQGLAIRYRCFLVQDRVYHFGVICEKANIGAEPVTKFLNSFKISEAK